MNAETTTLTAQELALYLGCEAKFECNAPFVGNMKSQLTALFLSEYERGNFISIKPILRPISAITEDEMKELYSLVFNRPFVGDNITHRDIGNKSERWVLWSGVERLFIYKDGDIGADSDLSHYRVPASTVLMWQLSKAFDIFNWIEQGKAIDKTKTK